MTFKIIDKKTGKEADTYKIALKEDWAKNLIYCDMEGFAIEEDGTLVLMDECGNVAYCPADRFEIVFDSETATEYPFYQEAYQTGYEEALKTCPLLSDDEVKQPCIEAPCDRPQGKWNEIQSGLFVCPFCGAYPHKEYRNFCPKCGADMRGNEKE